MLALFLKIGFYKASIQVNAPNNHGSYEALFRFNMQA